MPKPSTHGQTNLKVKIIDKPFIPSHAKIEPKKGDLVTFTEEPDGSAILGYPMNPVQHVKLTQHGEKYEGSLHFGDGHYCPLVVTKDKAGEMIRIQCHIPQHANPPSTDVGSWTADEDGGKYPPE